MSILPTTRACAFCSALIGLFYCANYFSFLSLTSIFTQSMKNCIKNMKARNRIKKKATKTRTTINISDELHEKGLARTDELHRGSFSNYVENLILDDVRQNGEAVAA